MAVYDNRVCRTCGAVFSGGPRAWYCPDCRLERKRAQSRYHSKHAPARHLGSTDKCQNCGAEYIVESGLQKYCKDCRDEMYRQLDNQQGTEYYHNMDDEAMARRTARRQELYPVQKDAVNAARRDSRPDTYCRHCGAPIRRGPYCPDCRREILALYNATHSPSKVAAAYGCGVYYVSSLRRREVSAQAGGPVEPKCVHCGAHITRGRYCDDCQRGILALYDVTQSPSKVAAAYGCNVSYVYFLRCKAASAEPGGQVVHKCVHCGAYITVGKYCADCQRGILALYDVTQSPSKVRAEYGCDRSYVYFLRHKKKPAKTDGE